MDNKDPVSTPIFTPSIYWIIFYKNKFLKNKNISFIVSNKLYNINSRPGKMLPSGVLNVSRMTMTPINEIMITIKYDRIFPTPKFDDLLIFL